MSVWRPAPPLRSGLDCAWRRPPPPLRWLARLLFVVGLALGACWLIPEGAPLGQAGTSVRGALGPTGWLVPLWVLVLALRFDRRARRRNQPVVTRQLLGGAALSLAALLAPSTPPAVRGGMAALGSGLVLPSEAWRRLRPALGIGARVLVVALVRLVRARRVLAWVLVATASRLVRVLRSTARILIDPFLLPPLVASEVLPEPHRKALLPPRRRLRGAARPRRRRGDAPPASHPDAPHASEEGTPAEDA